MGESTPAAATSDLHSLTLDELLDRIRIAYQFERTAAADLVERWINLGELLYEARERLPFRSWGPWCEENLPMKATTTNHYIRAFVYRDQLRAFTAGGGMDEMSSSHRSLTKVIPVALGGLPRLDAGRTNIPPEDIKRARELRADGLTWKRISTELGWNHDTLRRAVDPEFRRRYQEAAKRYKRRKREAAKALEQKRRAEAARKIGGNGAECYGDVRKALTRASAAIADAQSEDHRKAWREVERRLLRAEEAALDALGIERRAA